jgi:predicted nuclease with TOPRIM domain
MFILLYLIEQGILVILAFYVKSLTLLSCIVAIFALVVLTTFALHKLVMESRIKCLEHSLEEGIEDKKRSDIETKNIYKKHNELLDKVDEVSKEKTRLDEENKKIIKKYNQLLTMHDGLKKDLNTYDTKKGVK